MGHLGCSTLLPFTCISNEMIFGSSDISYSFLPVNTVVQIPDRKQSLTKTVIALSRRIWSRNSFQGLLIIRLTTFDEKLVDILIGSVVMAKTNPYES
ncbi:hypothetical protein CEXT_393011 [Caerostris extrusa]|uniref:Uncharacterized protein n=1 Tax=Caerostris extrusa TaxID=172846 RepID=A0AAV4XX58_CAEEX|nr:hypothetical protein CEXT_393011 [Caerostris extrusa]